VLTSHLVAYTAFQILRKCIPRWTCLPCYDYQWICSPFL
jgi:hypothetical protein